MRRKLGAFDDPELKSWLLELIADPSPSFLGALAESIPTVVPDQGRARLRSVPADLTD
jgi:hypothetical protein